MDAQGNLYGSSWYCGGYDGPGSIFELSPSSNGWIFTSLHEFTGGDDGSNPNSLTLGGNGKLYGTTYGGTLFEITP